MSKFVLSSGQQKQFILEHRYLRVVYASLPVDISSNGVSVFTVKNREVVDFEKGGISILIVNRNAEEVHIEFASEPRKVSGLDEVSLAEGASVTLAPGSQLNVGEVTFSPEQTLTIAPESTVQVSNLPTVQNVEVLNFPEILENQRVYGKVKKDARGGYIGLPVASFGVNPLVVGANVNRKELHIKAGISNSGVIYVGGTAVDIGIPLEAGEGMVFEVSAGLSLFATVAMDKVFLAEVVE